MTRLHVWGIGTLARGLDEPLALPLSRVADVPIKDHAKASLRRRFSELTRLAYVAACRAMAEAAPESPASLAIVGATGLGEATASLELIFQIHATRGVTVSPALVPNSVHSAPAGYLSIGLENRSPSVTVSQGFLSAEAALVAAADLLGAGLAPGVLLLAGDEADPAWAARLREAGAPEWAERLEAAAYQEGVVALVLGREPGGKGLGAVSAGLERCPMEGRAVAALLERAFVKPSGRAVVKVRASARGEELRRCLAEALRVPADTVALDGPGRGRSQAGALLDLAAAARGGAVDELLVLSAEIDELAFLHWVR